MKFIAPTYEREREKEVCSNNFSIRAVQADRAESSTRRRRRLEQVTAIVNWRLT